MEKLKENAALSGSCSSPNSQNIAPGFFHFEKNLS